MRHFLAKSDPAVSAIYTPRGQAFYGHFANAAATDQHPDALLFSGKTGRGWVKGGQAFLPSLAGKKKTPRWLDPASEPLKRIDRRVGSRVGKGHPRLFIVNPEALRTIRLMRPGDSVFVYERTGHYGTDAIAGLATVQSEPRPDPKTAGSEVVEIRFVARLDPPTTFDDIRKSGLFEDWPLVRHFRLTPVPAPEAFVAWMRGRYPQVF